MLEIRTGLTNQQQAHPDRPYKVVAVSIRSVRSGACGGHLPSLISSLSLSIEVYLLLLRIYKICPESSLNIAMPNSIDIMIF